MLEISHVTKKYRDKEALSDVSLTIPQGQIVGLLGENGAGKTTLMKCILGYLRHKGVVTLDGEAIGPGNIHRLSFATCEHSFFPALSPADHRDFYQAHFPAFNDRRFRLLTEFFQLPLHKPLRSFSTGMKNQLEVTLALSQGADYILMDEPFSGSDLFNREDFYRVMLGLLSDHETVILSTHLLEEVKTFLSRAVLLRQGRLIGDISQQEMEDEDLVTRVKQTYHYQADRVRKALSQLPDEEGGHETHMESHFGPDAGVCRGPDGCRYGLGLQGPAADDDGRLHHWRSRRRRGPAYGRPHRHGAKPPAMAHGLRPRRRHH